MGYRPLALGAIALLTFQVCFAQQPSLNLVTFEAPPYQISREGTDIRGETVNTVTCAAKAAGWTTNITMVPQKRAIYSLKRNMADGYFAADPSAELDAIARQSYPVALEKWYFFTLDASPKLSKDRIGVVDGSNEEAWLKANDYNIYLSVTSPKQLLALLERGRINAALMDERVMQDLNTDSGTPAIDSLHSHFLRYAPLHLYLGDVFQVTYPNFLSAFNEALPTCMGKNLQLSERELTHIEVLTRRLLAELRGLLNLQQALKAGPKPSTLAEVLSIDSKWQALAPKAELPLASHILNLPASQTLKNWQGSYQGLITEVMLVDSMGAIAAMSQVTSDYWQGDESKFLEVAGSESTTEPRDRDFLFVSPIRYDQSTTRFQITVSAPLFADGAKTPNGVIVLGLDIEEAMGI
ncbi:substrate-binding periplasmic protein [Marinobacter sp.]|uniref:substrate-binding periplasmic protein n=1 Tax=Marinobacter sp. TaxID=50741 RepID=UPI003A8F029D